MNKNDEVICVARIVVKKDEVQKVENIFRDMIKQSLKEEGCISYTLQKDIDNPFAYTFIDKFKDSAAFELHCNQKHIIEYFDNQLPTLTEEIRIEVYKGITL